MNKDALVMSTAALPTAFFRQQADAFGAVGGGVETSPKFDLWPLADAFGTSAKHILS